MPSMISPPAFLAHTIHRPDRGSEASVPAERPTAISTAVMPSENTKRYRNPNVALRVPLTNVRTAAKAGAPHGAATRPDVAPIRNTDPADCPPNLDAQATSFAGADTGNTSSIARAARRSRLPIVK